MLRVGTKREAFVIRSYETSIEIYSSSTLTARANFFRSRKLVPRSVYLPSVVPDFFLVAFLTITGARSQNSPTQAKRVLLPRRIQSVRFYTYIPRDESTRRRLRKALQLVKSLHDKISSEKVARLRKLRHCDLARRSSPSGVRLDYSPLARTTICPQARLMLLRARPFRIPKASLSLRPLRDATRRTREQCVRARGCARARTPSCLYVAAVYVYINVYVLCVRICV